MKETFERKIQIRCEIEWLKNKLKKKLTQRQRKTFEHQIRKKEYDLELGIFPND